MFFQLLELKQSQMKTATTMAPNKRLYMHACFYFFAHLSAFVRKKIRECDNQKFKVLRTQTFNRITSNSKRARTKFKLIGKFKMPRKLKQQKAFPARSLSFFFIYSLLYAKQQGFETEHKYFAIKYQIQNVRVQSLS